VNQLIWAFGGIAGWVIGILATPLDAKQVSQFSQVWKAAAAFASGVIVAHVAKFADDGGIGRLLGSERDLGRILILSIMFLDGTLFTFISRTPPPSER
jgi:hypothetical protein